MDSLGWLPSIMDGVGTVGIVVITGWLIFTGRLVPAKYYDEAVKDRDTWKRSALESSGQLDKIVNNKDLGIAVLQAIEAKAREGDSS